MGWGVVEMDPGIALQPPIALAFVDVEIVQDDMDVLVGVFGEQLFHEVQEVHAPAALVVAGLDLAGGHVEGGEQRGGAIALVLVGKAGDRAARRQPQVALRTLKGLNVGLFVHAEHQRVFRRVQVEAHDVGRLGGKLRIGADAPGAAALELDAMLAQDRVDLVLRHIAQRLGEQAAVPGGIPAGRGLVQQGQDALFRCRAVAHRLARARRVAQAVQAIGGKARAPLAHRGRRQPHARGDVRGGLAFGRGQYDLGPGHHAPLGLGPAHHAFQRGAFLIGEDNRGGWLAHATPIRYTAN